MNLADNRIENNEFVVWLYRKLKNARDENSFFTLTKVNLNKNGLKLDNISRLNYELYNNNLV